MIRVGLTLDQEIGEDAELRYRLKAAYVRAVRRAGALPLLLPDLDPEAASAALETLDALVITGGAFDVPPEAYGESPHEGLGTLVPDRTRSETLLGQGALARGLPLLGVCGGMQLLNVLRGGTLVQDIEREIEGAHAHEQSHDRTKPAHPLFIEADTRLAALLDPGELQANSTHHQAVARVGAGLVVSARADDGVIEAIEGDDVDDNAPFVLGVQWHPELLGEACASHLRLYDALVAAARRRRC